MKRIKTEQLPSEGKTKFLEERKAFKTTSIIIALVFLSYVPIYTYVRDIERYLARYSFVLCFSKLGF